jgi:DNA end-binding protein Ku
MSARAMGSATISFGLVSIPIKLYPATRPSGTISFNLLHGKCGSRLKQQYICTTDNEIVSRDQMVKGYEFAKDRYVTFSPEELKELEEKATQTIDIAEFIPIDKIDPVYFDKPYYLGPDKGGAKAYSLLAETMQRTGRVALARYAARGKQYLTLIRAVVEDTKMALVMHQLLYADEVRPVAEVPLDRVEVREQELKLATQLVDQITSERFRPEAYEDDVKKRIEAVIEKKVAGQEVQFALPPAPEAPIIDLMEALKASLAGKQPAKEAAGEEERKPPKRAPRETTEVGKRAKK